MDKKTYIRLLQNPTLISEEVNIALLHITQQYPYFQSARALRLKTLKNQGNYKYNSELKITAGHTIDRTVLFDFITTSYFEKPSGIEKKSLKEILLPKLKSELKTVRNIQIEKEDVLDIKNNLEIGKPISFTKNESFSFNQWMQLSSKKHIVRTLDTRNNTTEKNNIINRFIETAPKIPRPDKKNTPEIKVTETKQNNQLATETLAKVYLEQKKYDSAIQAYKILSLKYPEKSGYFADQIKRIQILQKNK
ncbi:hypothetical protein [Tenacibaculum aestuariivivum]|uniref:hypothetical protein n=1 Tax=Tenacibaculum aestuariivivum TaxID=2006131 RepID=UPI003AB5DE61